MSSSALCPPRPDSLPWSSAAIVGGYFFCIFSEARPALLQLVFDDAYCQFSESFGKPNPERPEHVYQQDERASQQFLGRVSYYQVTF